MKARFKSAVDGIVEGPARAHERAEMTARVAHIVLDEKFIDNAIWIFDSLSGLENEYLLVRRKGAISLITRKERITIFRSQLARLLHVWKSKPDIIILHSLFFGATLVPFVSRRAPLVWVSWGNDLYKDSSDAFCSSYPFRPSLFLSETRKWKDSQKPGISDFLKARFIAFVRNVLRAAAIKRIGYISTCLPYEFPAIQARYPHVKRFVFDYIDETPTSLPRCDGSSVLVGNSGSPNCNHLDVLKIMEEFRDGIDRVIVPLSYAGGAAYQEMVVKAGREKFGDRFVPLTSYMGIDEYARLLSSCGYAIMGFLRQQATKTIQLLLYQGTKIFFFKGTEIFRYFKDSGYAVFSIEEDLARYGFGSPLSDRDCKRNQELVGKQFNCAANIQAVACSVEEVLRGVVS